MREIVRVENLNISYRGQEALRNISFSVREGDYVGIVGPNGSGKTTLLKSMLGLVHADSGTVSLFGEPSGKFSSWHKIGYVPQKTALKSVIFPVTSEEVVGMGLLSLKTFPRRLEKGDREAVENAMALAGALELKGRHINEMSGGQQQRVLLARALVSKPKLLFLDEPTSALDHDSREKLFDTLASLSKNGITIMMVTHDMSEVGKHAGHMLFIDREVMFFGTMDDFCHSASMEKFFGGFAQHIICHRHDGAQHAGD